jgi:hypothetical protein
MPYQYSSLAQARTPKLRLTVILLLTATASLCIGSAQAQKVAARTRTFPVAHQDPSATPKPRPNQRLGTRADQVAHGTRIERLLAEINSLPNTPSKRNDFILCGYKCGPSDKGHPAPARACREIGFEILKSFERARSSQE